MSRVLSTLVLLAGAVGPLLAQQMPPAQPAAQPAAPSPQPSQPPERREPRWGIGVSLNPSAILNLNTGSLTPFSLGDLYLPIYASATVRLEPEFGVLHFSSSTSSTGGGTYASSLTSLRLVMGVFGVLRHTGPVRIYLGPRIGVLRTTTSSQSPGSPSTSTSRNDLFIAGAFGGEYFFTPHFSLGGEAQLQYVKFGNTSYTPPPAFPQPSTDQHTVSTSALVFVRVYP